MFRYRAELVRTVVCAGNFIRIDLLSESLTLVGNGCAALLRSDAAGVTVLDPASSLVSFDPAGHYDHPARDPRALASRRFSSLLALEITVPGRPTANRCGFAGIDPADEH